MSDRDVGEVLARTGARPFTSLLVANRGEVAVRVLDAARRAGLRTVAVFSDADADAPHVRRADEAVRLGPAPARDSYLDVDALLAAAHRTGAEAVHPGYGFLAEHAGFARAVVDAGLVWVGPPPDVVATMGDKAAAKRLLGPAGVPLLPGHHEDGDADDAELLAAAERLGLPLMVKAAAGGGGKGMRLVTDAAALPDALAAARREATAAFGDPRLLLERALLAPRHVEVQVVADHHGTVRSYGVRDCSVQRRHQKVVEEAGEAVVDDDVRERLEAAATTAAREVGYVSAGTVEFLLDPATGDVAFLEMNTRLQVEHRVTEQVAAVDLVRLQLDVAAGRPLEDGPVTISGHAVEVRLYAEAPAAGFLPQVGTVRAWQPPSSVDVDTGLAEGGVVGPHYDPLLAKLVAAGRDRRDAAAALATALDGTVCLGLRTNRTFLARVLRHPAFLDAAPTTALLDDHDLTVDPVTSADVVAVAGWWHLHRRAAAARRAPGLDGWTTARWLVARQLLRLEGHGDQVHDCTLRDRPDGGVEVTLGGQPHEVTAGSDHVVVDGRRRRLVAVPDGGARLLVHLPHADLDVRDVLLAPPADVDAGGAGVLVAPMHGTVVEVRVAVGDRVEVGATVAVVEAMKMEHAVVADTAGTVDGLPAAVGSQVAAGDLLARVVPADGASPDAG